MKLFSPVLRPSQIQPEGGSWPGAGEGRGWACLLQSSPERISCTSVSWFSWWEVFLSPTWWSSLPVTVSALSRVDLWPPNLQFSLLSTILSSLWGRKTMLFASSSSHWAEAWVCDSVWGESSLVRDHAKQISWDIILPQVNVLKTSLVLRKHE